MSSSDFARLVGRVAAERGRCGTLDADFLDAVGVVLGTGGLLRLVASLEQFPVFLATLDADSLVDLSPRRLASSVAALARREQADAAVIQLERARCHLSLLDGVPVGLGNDRAGELDQLAEDLIAGRSVV
jgi:hypothetical protein